MRGMPCPSCIHAMQDRDENDRPYWACRLGYAKARKCQKDKRYYEDLDDDEILDMIDEDDE